MENGFDDFMQNDGEFPVDGSTDSENPNLLPRARYIFEIIDAGKHISNAGNPCIDVTFDIEGFKIKECFVLNNNIGAGRWKQLLYAVGIRNKGKHWVVNKEILIGKKGKGDVIIEKRTYGDGSSSPKNKISSFSPIEEETAPVVGVPDEKGASTEVPDEESAEAPAEEQKPEEEKKPVEQEKETEEVEDDI